jgi:hypothetical protein
MNRTPGGQLAYLGNVAWQEIPRDDQAFYAFIDQVLALLELPEPPASHPNCDYCRYRSAARENGL